MGGQAPASYDVSQTSASDLLRIVPVVLIIIGILLAIMLRSLIAPIYLVLSVLLSYLASLGLAILVFVVIGGDPGLNFVLPFLMFVFLMALGEDYNILVMSRIREEAHDFPLTPAVRRAVAVDGRHGHLRRPDPGRHVHRAHRSPRPARCARSASAWRPASCSTPSSCGRC